MNMGHFRIRVGDQDMYSFKYFPKSKLKSLRLRSVLQQSHISDVGNKEGIPSDMRNISINIDKNKYTQHPPCTPYDISRHLRALQKALLKNGGQRNMNKNRNHSKYKILS
jgi:hypothetical protein